MDEIIKNIDKGIENGKAKANATLTSLPLNDGLCATPSKETLLLDAKHELLCAGQQASLIENEYLNEEVNKHIDAAKRLLERLST